MTFFLVLLFFVIPCGCFTSEIASGKGYSGTSWFIGGLLFGPIALIGAAGLPDRKLRKYLRQIGESQGAFKSQGALKAEPVPINLEEQPKENIIGGFELNKNAEEDQLWETILSILRTRNIDDQADRSKSYINDPMFGTTEFVVNNSNRELLAFAVRKKHTDEMFYWEVNLS